MASCGGQVSIVTSGAGVVASSSAMVKAYNGIDIITIMETDKSIKTHVHDHIKNKISEKNKKHYVKIKDVVNVTFEYVVELKEKNYVLYLP